MSAPLVIQNSALTVATVSATTITLTGVAANSTLVVLLALPGGARTYTITDDKSNTWSASVFGSASLRTSRVMYAINVASGTTQITITQSGGAFVAYTVQVVEIEQSTFIEESTYSDIANNTTHYMAASGKLDTGANAIILGIGQHNASGGTVTKGTSHTLLTSTTTIITQYIRSDSGFTDQRSSWTTTTARSTFGGSAAFESVGGSTFKPAFTLSNNIILGI